MALAKCERTDEAIGHFQKALAIKPDLAEADYYLGTILAGCGRIDEAIAHYQTALKIRPDLAEAHYHLGVILARLGRTDEAVGHYRQALVIAQRQNKAALVAQLKARLALYQSESP
jgi:Flp pilus assembly protein TadD